MWPEQPRPVGEKLRRGFGGEQRQGKNGQLNGLNGRRVLTALIAVAALSGAGPEAKKRSLAKKGCFPGKSGRAGCANKEWCPAPASST